MSFANILFFVDAFCLFFFLTETKRNLFHLTSVLVQFAKQQNTDFLGKMSPKNTKPYVSHQDV